MRVLILGGGGTLGAFSAGALLALEQAGWQPDALIGSSAGSINLLRWTVGGAGAAVEFWRGLRWPILLREGVGPSMRRHGLLDPVSFRARVEQGVDFGALLADPRSFAFLVVDLESGLVKVRGNRSEPSSAALRGVSAASYALPPLLPPVDVEGAWLSDGGLLHNAPLEKAMKLGATEIVYLCNVQVVPREGYKERSILAAAGRYAEIFLRRASNVGFADAEVVEGRYRGIPFLTIAPPSSLRLESMLTWMLPGERTMGRLIDLGRECAERALAARSLEPLDVRPNRPTVVVEQRVRSG